MIVHTGEALIDFIPTADRNGKGAYVPVPGGSPYNTAIATARLEVPNSFFGRISTDFFGDLLVAHLRENGVGTEYLLRDRRLSTLAFVKRSDSGEARYAFFCENAADRAVTVDDLPEIPEEVQAIQFGSISLIASPVGPSIIRLVERERRSRVVSFDPNIRESIIEDEDAYRTRIERAIGASTIVKISDEDLLWISKSTDKPAAAAEMLEAGAHLIVVTEGARGATAYTGSFSVFEPARQVTVADTVGAGDSFHGGLLAWLYHNGLLDNTAISSLTEGQATKMLRFAAAVSAGTCSRPGNDPPRLKELTDLDEGSIRG